MSKSLTLFATLRCFFQNWLFGSKTKGPPTSRIYRPSVWLNHKTDEFTAQRASNPASFLTTLKLLHMRVMAFQITGNWTVCSTAYTGLHQRSNQISALLDLCRGIHRSPVVSPNKRASNGESAPTSWCCHDTSCEPDPNVPSVYLISADCAGDLRLILPR